MVVICLLVHAGGEEAAIHGKALAGDVTGRVGREQHRRADKFVGLAKAAHGRAHQKFFAARRAVEQLSLIHISV